MNISDEMKLVLRRQLDAEEDVVQANDRLDAAHLAVIEQQNRENLLDREVEAMLAYMEQSETVPLNRPDDSN